MKSIDKTKSQLYQIADNEAKQYFLNAFSVNDTPSASNFLNFWLEKLQITDKIVIIFNTRSDRPLRTQLFTEWIKLIHTNVATVIITGNQKKMANRLLTDMKLNIEIENLKINSKTDIKKSILAKAKNTKLIVGIGNIKGLGYRILESFC